MAIWNSRFRAIIKNRTIQLFTFLLFEYRKSPVIGFPCIKLCIFNCVSTLWCHRSRIFVNCLGTIHKWRHAFLLGDMFLDVVCQLIKIVYQNSFKKSNLVRKNTSKSILSAQHSRLFWRSLKFGSNFVSLFGHFFKLIPRSCLTAFKVFVIIVFSIQFKSYHLKQSASVTKLHYIWSHCCCQLNSFKERWFNHNSIL